jgi:hypothetical protein
MKKYTLLFFISIQNLVAFSQAHVKDSLLLAPLVGLSYSYQIPGGDLKTRFGNNSNVGAMFLVKTKSNWLIGADYSFLFGNKLKETGILDSIKTESGFVIDVNGQYAETRLFERGYSASLKFGKLFPYLSPNKNSGFIFIASVGMLQHKIRIEDIGNRSPQLTKEYRKGYDRLTNGMAITEFIGYLLLSNNRLINLFGGFEFTQAFTQNRRSYNFDTMERDTKKRKDYLSGFRFGIIIPLYKRGPQDFYYN